MSASSLLTAARPRLLGPLLLLPAALSAPAAARAQSQPAFTSLTRAVHRDIDGQRAFRTVEYVQRFFRLPGNDGFDAAIDYRGKDEAALTAAIAEACPDGVDVIFENVGGIILDAGLMNLNLHSRVGLCGLISEYNTEPRGIRNLWQLIVKRAHIRGLLVADYVPRFGEGAAQMGVWAAQGKLTIDEHIDEGLEHAFDSFMRLFAGTNDGKMILKIS